MGYWLQTSVLRAVGSRAERPALASQIGAGGALIMAVCQAGFSEWPLISLALGLAGFGAIIVRARSGANALAHSCLLLRALDRHLLASSCRWRPPDASFFSAGFSTSALCR